MIFQLIIVFLAIFSICSANLLWPAILSTTIELNSNTIEYVGFPQSALNRTEVQISLLCADNLNVEFDVQFVLRSSPCDKEFFDVRRQAEVKELLSFYFDNPYEIPSGYSYDKILFYKSKPQRFNCQKEHGYMLFAEQLPHEPMTVHHVHQHNSKMIDPLSSDANHVVRKREYSGLNGNSLDGGAKMSLTSWHPVQTLPADGIYFLVLKFTAVKFPSNEISSVNVTMEIQWRGPYGYLSAIDYPLLNFYALMCVFYTVLAIVWLIVCLMHWKDILRIQFWIGAVIIIGMIEKAMFYSEYHTMNHDGKTVQGFIEAAELISCLKRTMSRVLIIIVSVGYGVVKPRLGKMLGEVVVVGVIYFVFCAIEGLARVSKSQSEAMRQKQLAALPLIMIEVIIFWWIFTALITTMRALRLRKNMVKLNVYRHFTNALCFTVIASAVFIIWKFYMHDLQLCLQDWKEYWIDTAFWHVLFCVILVVIMILWRPSKNNQRYAFTPLLDDSEDENDEDELFNSSFYAANAVNQRNSEAKPSSRKQKEEVNDRRIKEELKWIDDNIPSSIADRLLVEDEDEKEQIELERSKLL
ncbi:hypothetical protein AB6A40_005295 [Gnathostoma spinigerum]|uniref:GOST seven transmembrane domain-containing protein n=1 Tax=Gnathostoma spinigerum TaxID=75299 RepID=A0ABD6EH93_9BILA